MLSGIDVEFAQFGIEPAILLLSPLDRLVQSFLPVYKAFVEAKDEQLHLLDLLLEDLVLPFQLQFSVGRSFSFRQRMLNCGLVIFIISVLVATVIGIVAHRSGLVCGCNVTGVEVVRVFLDSRVYRPRAAANEGPREDGTLCVRK